GDLLALAQVVAVDRLLVVGERREAGQISLRARDVPDCAPHRGGAAFGVGGLQRSLDLHVKDFRTRRSRRAGLALLDLARRALGGRLGDGRGQRRTLRLNDERESAVAALMEA